MTTTVLDSRELLLTGLITVLTPQLTGLVAPDAIHASWQQANLAGGIGTGPTQQPTLVIIDLGNETPQTPQPIRNERTTTVPYLPGAASTTRLVADQSQMCPVTITCAAAGETAEGTCGLIVATVKTALGQTAKIALPDTNTSDPPTFGYGLSAQVVRTGTRPHTRDPLKQIYATSILHTAYYADYHLETPTIAQTVTLQETFTEGLLVTQQTVNRTHS